MDYGGLVRGHTGGLWSGEVQFNEKYRREDICEDLRMNLPKCIKDDLFFSLADEANPWYTDGTNGAGRGATVASASAALLLALAPAAALLA